jgi:predicted phosphohydrolase
MSSRSRSRSRRGSNAGSDIAKKIEATKKAARNKKKKEVPLPIKLQVQSDVHLDYQALHPRLIPKAEILILAGDIGNIVSEPARMEAFFKRVSSQWTLVIYVLGNHEYWEGSVSEMLKKYRAFIAGFPNVHLLERGILKFRDIVFAGATMWSHIPEASAAEVRETMNDYERTAHLTVARVNKMHETAVAFFQKTIKKYPDHRVVCISHHAPVVTRIHLPGTKGTTHISRAYCTNLTSMFQKNLIMWIFGHTHFSCDFKVGKTRLVANQCGYSDQFRKGITHYSTQHVISIP